MKLDRDIAASTGNCFCRHRFCRSSSFRFSQITTSFTWARSCSRRKLKSGAKPLFLKEKSSSNDNNCQEDKKKLGSKELDKKHDNKNHSILSNHWPHWKTTDASEATNRTEQNRTLRPCVLYSVRRAEIDIFSKSSSWRITSMARRLLSSWSSGIFLATQSFLERIKLRIQQVFQEMPFKRCSFAVGDICANQKKRLLSGQLSWKSTA